MIVGIIVVVIFIIIILNIANGNKEKELQRNLLNAVEAQDKETVKKLIEEGADVNFVYDERTLLDYARDDEIITILKKHGAKTKSELDDVAKLSKELLGAALKGDKNKILNLIEKGANVNFKDELGNTALLSVINGFLFHFKDDFESFYDVLKFLLENGADANAKNNEGKTALLMTERELLLSLGVENCQQAIGIAKLLLDNGADVNQKDNEGLTPLMHSVNFYRGFMSLLIEYGADVNAQDEKGGTALMWAIISANIARKEGRNLDAVYFSCIEFLIKKGANLELKTSRNGETALIWASQFGFTDIVKLLLEKGAKVNARAYNGATSYSVALAYNQDEVARLLKSYGGVL